MKYPWAVVGQKVEAFGIADGWDHLRCNIPVNGGIYIIRDVYASGEKIMLRLKEIKNPRKLCTKGLMEPSFSCVTFRPIYPQKRASDIAQFAPLLNPAIGIYVDTDERLKRLERNNG